VTDEKDFRGSDGVGAFYDSINFLNIAVFKSNLPDPQRICGYRSGALVSNHSVKEV